MAGYYLSGAPATGYTTYAWGRNWYGQLGDGTTTNRSVPVMVGNYAGWAFVPAGGDGGFTEAVRSDGTLWAWGANESGQLGDGTITDRSTPGQVGTDNHWASVSTGNWHTVAIKTDGTLWAWGSNSAGQLGDGTTTSRNTPVRVGTDTHWAFAEAGSFHSAAVKTDGTLWTWGWNSFGQLGDGTTTNRNAPLQVGTDWASASAGFGHTIGLRW